MFRTRSASYLGVSVCAYEIYWGCDLSANERENNILCILYSQSLKVILYSVFSSPKEVRWEAHKMAH